MTRFEWRQDWNTKPFCDKSFLLTFDSDATANTNSHASALWRLLLLFLIHTCDVDTDSEGSGDPSAVTDISIHWNCWRAKMMCMECKWTWKVKRADVRREKVSTAWTIVHIRVWLPPAVHWFPSLSSTTANCSIPQLLLSSWFASDALLAKRSHWIFNFLPVCSNNKMFFHFATFSLSSWSSHQIEFSSLLTLVLRIASLYLTVAPKCCQEKEKLEMKADCERVNTCRFRNQLPPLTQTLFPRFTSSSSFHLFLSHSIRSLALLLV